MEKFEFHLTDETQTDQIYNMFLAAISEMDKNGINQWDNIYPDKDIIVKDILNRQMYVGTHNKIIVSAFVINTEYDVEYNNGNWCFPNTGYKVVHRLCVNPLYQNKGIGRQAMLYIEHLLKAQGIEAIRLDAFTQNPYALKLYEKLGYKKVGFANWRKGKFYLMEKKI